MPPKKQQSNKSTQKKVQKIVEDKTFGLKNKNKSKKVAQYVATVAANAKLMGKNRKQVKEEDAMKAQRDAVKQGKQDREAELSSLFKAVVDTQKVPQGADPKSVICVHYKAGACSRGKKCKFSHDFEQVRKVAKLDLYSDPRAQERDTIDKWDQGKLESVVNSKADSKISNETQIVCKYFLDAIESLKYGWFWSCPNGDSCKYKHRLPPGFVFKPKKDKKRDDAEEDAEDEKLLLLEEIEDERKKLDLSKCQAVTLQTFLKWRDEKKKKKEADIESKRKDAERKSGGRGLGVLSGRALFQFDPSLFVDDDEAAGGDTYEIQDETEEDLKERQEEEAKEEERLQRERQLREAAGDFEEEKYEEDGEDEEQQGDQQDGEEDGEGEGEGEGQQEEAEEGEEEQPNEEKKKTKTKMEQKQKQTTKEKEKVKVDVDLFLDDDQLPSDEEDEEEQQTQRSKEKEKEKPKEKEKEKTEEKKGGKEGTKKKK